MNVQVFQFIKNTGPRFGESRAADKLNIPWSAMGDGFTWLSKDIDASADTARAQWEEASRAILTGMHEIVILDEFTYPLVFGWIQVDSVLDVLRRRPEMMHVVITGRNAPEALIEFADLVTEMREINTRSMSRESERSRASSSGGMTSASMSLDEAVARIRQLDTDSMGRASKRHTALTKPPGSLGQLEELSIRLAGIMRTEQPRISDRAIVIAAGDHGVVAQGVAAYPQDVTAQMVLNFLSGGAAINVMCRQLGIRQIIVDAGITTDIPRHPDFRTLGIGRGTADMSQGPAMTPAQARACLEAGIGLAQECVESSIDLIGTGDMGIGNTTASAAITSAVTSLPPEETTGDGAGRPARGLEHKVDVIRRALEVNAPDPTNGLSLLSGVGGFEIGVLAGVIVGAAAHSRPVVLGGFISGAAALIARAVAPTTHDYKIAAHVSAERGHQVALNHLGLTPLLDLGMRLGEGTGAALAMPIIEVAAACLSDMATFAEAGVSGPADEPGAGGGGEQ